MQTIIDFLRLLLGQYIPQTTTGYYLDKVSNTYVEYQYIPGGFGSLNIEYICGFLLLVLFVYFIIRAIYLLILKAGA